jgi:hypothetical protein
MSWNSTMFRSPSCCPAGSAYRRGTGCSRNWEAAETIRDLEDRLVEAAAARWRARLAFATRIRRCSPKRSEL